MSDGNGTAPTSNIGGAVGDISKLLQDKAPEALDAPAVTAPPASKPPAPSLDPGLIDHDAVQATQTAAEAGAAAAATDADGAQKHDTELAVEGLSMADVAEKLGVPARKLYEDLQIPLQDPAGGSATIGELKEQAQRVATLDADRATFEDDRGTWQNDVMVARQEMGNAVEVVSSALVARFGQTEGRAIMAEAINLAQQSNADRRAENSQKLFQRFPAWKDDTVRRAVRDDMVVHLKPWGFNAQHVDSIDDPQTLAYIHDNMARDAQITKARGKLEPATDTGKRQSAPGARRRDPPPAVRSKQAAVARARETGDRQDVIAGVHSILAASRKE